jgi:hypothetical protein
MNKLTSISPFIFLLFFQTINAQTTKPDSLKPITTIGIFDGKKVWEGNFQSEEVYKINGYCIALADMSQTQVDSLKGKKIIVSGKLKIKVGKTFPAKTSSEGRIYEPYKEPDRKFISEPKFIIYYETREPIKK